MSLVLTLTYLLYLESNKHTQIQTDRQTNRQTERQTDRETYLLSLVTAIALPPGTNS